MKSSWLLSTWSEIWEVFTMMKRIVMFFICMVVMLSVVPASDVQAAKAKPKLSAKTKTMYVGDTCKIKLKNASSKVKWKTSKKSVVFISKKKGKTITIKAKKPGKATVTATYKGKKYKCKITVKKKVVPDNPMLNATDVTLCKRSEEYEGYITHDESHIEEFRFRVTGTKKEVRKWELVGEDAEFFTITDYGLVKVRYGSVYYEPVKQVTVKATLEDGRVLTATVRSYTEANLGIERIFKGFKDTYITADMTEVDKAKKVAWYVSAISDYEAYNDDWYSIFIKGRGDCMASRYAVAYLCEYVGVKAQACRSIEAHGMTVVKADGKYYLVVTGYEGSKPRDFSMYEIDEVTVRSYGEKYDLYIGYFGLE